MVVLHVMGIVQHNACYDCGWFKVVWCDLPLSSFPCARCILHHSLKNALAKVAFSR